MCAIYRLGTFTHLLTLCLLEKASPRDRIWGIGFGAKNAGSQRKRWGQNLLGKCLMDVRDRIREEEERKLREEEEDPVDEA